MEEMKKTLKFNYLSLFNIAAFKFQVEEIKKDELDGLAEFFLSEDSLVEAIGIPPRKKSETRYHKSVIEEYLKKKGVGMTKANKLYVSSIIFRHILMDQYMVIDEEILDPTYLQQRPFIRLKLRNFSLNIPESMDFSREVGKLDCHPFALIHRLGAVVLTTLIEIPSDIELSVNDVNLLIESLDKKMKLSESLRDRAYYVILPLLSYRIFGKYNYKELSRTEQEELTKEVMKRLETSLSTWITCVWKPEQLNEDLINSYKLQLSSLVSGTGNWRLRSRHSAEEDFKEAIVYSLRDGIILAHIRGVFVNLRRKIKELNVRDVDKNIRDKNSEKSLSLMIPARRIVYPYQLLMAIDSTLDAYNRRIREMDAEKANINDIRKLRDIVERGLDELDSYSLIEADPYRSVFRRGAKNRGLFRLEKIVRRKIRYFDSLISSREGEEEKGRDRIIGILLSLLGIYQVIEVVTGRPMMEAMLFLIPALFIATLLVILIRKEISSIFRKIKGFLLRKS
jgi:hypothetical protein